MYIYNSKMIPVTLPNAGTQDAIVSWFWKTERKATQILPYSFQRTIKAKTNLPYCPNQDPDGPSSLYQFFTGYIKCTTEMLQSCTCTKPRKGSISLGIGGDISRTRKLMSKFQQEKPWIFYGIAIALNNPPQWIGLTFLTGLVKWICLFKGNENTKLQYAGMLCRWATKWNIAYENVRSEEKRKKYIKERAKISF